AHYAHAGAGGFNQTPNGGLLLGDPATPGNSAAGGVGGDNLTEVYFFPFTPHTQDPGPPPVPESDYVGVISLNAAFDTALYNFFFPVTGTDGGGALAIAARSDGTNVTAIGGVFLRLGARPLLGAGVAPAGVDDSGFLRR